MKSFDNFLNQLLGNPTKQTTVTVNGKRKKLKALALYTSVNFEGDTYYKAAFQDHSYLAIIPSEKGIYYMDKPLGVARGISDKTIGNKKITYKGKIYELVNKDDYQFCLKVYLGKPHTDIEGECKFSDYVSADETEMFSLGWLSYDGKRADSLMKKIDLENVQI